MMISGWNILLIQVTGSRSGNTSALKTRRQRVCVCVCANVLRPVALICMTSALLPTSVCVKVESHSWRGRVCFKHTHTFQTHSVVSRDRLRNSTHSVQNSEELNGRKGTGSGGNYRGSPGSIFPGLSSVTIYAYRNVTSTVSAQSVLQ